MTGFSHLPLQQAIYQALSGDSALAATVSGIYDRPPQGAAFPYLTLGEAQISEWSTKTVPGTEQLVTLHAWSREGGRAETATIMERVYQLLHEANLTVTGQTLVSLRFFASEITLGDDGWSYQGKMQFHAFLQAS